MCVASSFDHAHYPMTIPMTLRHLAKAFHLLSLAMALVLLPQHLLVSGTLSSEQIPPLDCTMYKAIFSGDIPLHRPEK